MRSLLAIVALLVGCNASPRPFHCTTDAQCGVGGQCIAGGCAFSSTDCPSGLRYDKTAGGACVPVIGGDMAGSPPVDLAMSPPDLVSVDLATGPVPADIWDTTASPVGSKYLYAVWGPSADSVFVAGEAGTLLHSTNHGASWTASTAGTQALVGIFGVGGVVFVAGNNGTILRSTDGGMTWSPPTSITPATTQQFNSIWGSDLNNLYAVGNNIQIYKSTDGGLTWNSSNSGTVNTTPMFTSFEKVWGSSATDIYVAGGPSVIYHSTDGTTWTAQFNSGYAQGLHDIWGRSASDLYAIGPNFFYSSNGSGSWTSPSGQLIEHGIALAGVGPGQLYLLSLDAQVFYVSNAGATITRASTTTFPANWTSASIWASSPTDVYVVGQGYISHGHN